MLLYVRRETELYCGFWACTKGAKKIHLFSSMKSKHTLHDVQVASRGCDNFLDQAIRLDILNTGYNLIRALSQVKNYPAAVVETT